MFNSAEFCQNKRSGAASICIKKLKMFDNNTFKKIKKIIELFNISDFYCELEIFDSYKIDVINDLQELKSVFKAKNFKNKKGVAVRGAINNLREIFLIIERYNLKESRFFTPKNISWEEFLVSGIDEKYVESFEDTDVIVSLYDHAGYHHIVFNTALFDFETIKYKIQDICNNI